MSGQARAKKWLFNALRLGVCAAAMFLVLRGVRWEDTVRLTDGSELFGQLRKLDERIGEESRYALRTPDGTEVRLRQSELAFKKGEGQDIGEPDVALGLRSVAGRARLWMIPLALLVFAPGTFLQALRFRWMLRTQEIRVSFWESLKLCYVGNFLNFVFAVGATAGDAFKMYAVARHSKRSTESVMIVILDRVAGMLGLMILVLALAFFTPKLASFRGTTLALLVGGAVASFLYFFPPVRRLAPAEWLNRLPKIEHLRRMDRTAVNCVRHLRLTAGAILATIALQFFCIGSYVVAAMSFGFEIPNLGRLFEFYAYFGAGWFISAIPVSIQGMGTVELAYLQMFKDYGSASLILFLAIAVRLVQFFSSLPGGVIFMMGAHHLPTETEMDALEAPQEPGRVSPHATESVAACP